MQSTMPTRACQPDVDHVGAFSIIGRVRDALRKAGREDRAREFVEKAFRAGSYDGVLQLCMEYVEVV